LRKKKHSLDLFKVKNTFVAATGRKQSGDKKTIVGGIKSF
jgi:hypothetical protein